MDAEQKTRKLSSLDRTQIKGRQAEALLLSIGPYLESLQKQLVDALIQNTRAEGKVDEHSARMLVAEYEFRDMLSRDIRRGAAAGNKIKDVMRAGDSE